VIGVAKEGNPSPHFFPCASKPTTEANEADKADVKADKAIVANEIDNVADKPGGQ
jgi:hypothetical protein